MPRTSLCQRPPIAGALATLVWLAAAAHAATPPAPAPAPEPARASMPAGLPAVLDPQAPVPSLVYRSSLADHRRLGDDAQVPWPEANATVGRIGGWRAYLREAHEPAPAETTAPATTPATAPAARPDAAPPQPAPHRPAPAGHHQH